MLYTTKGIVIHHFKYGEKSVIAKVYTEKFGLQSFILNGVRNKKSKNKAVYLQPLSLIEINAIYKEKKGLQQVKSIQLETPFVSIPFNISKSSIAFFIAELLHKSIKEEEPNLKLFNFLHNSIQILDLKTDNYVNFHLIFLAHLSKHLGFYPRIPLLMDSTAYFFDLQEGGFVEQPPQHKAFISPPISTFFHTVFGTSFEALETLTISAEQRKLLLNTFMDYYNLHLSNFDKLKSLDVLEEVLN